MGIDADYIFSAVVTITVAISIAFFKWLSFNFHFLSTALDTHEAKDQERYEDTVQRLTKIETIVINGHK